jgi:diacylglycerol kinase family enzyme
MNEVAQGVVHTPAALALVPCGSGNGLALHVGLPLSPLAALAVATGPGGRVAAVDTGEADGRPFFNAMGLGLDAEVSARFNRLTRRGLPAYARTAWRTWRDLRAQTVTVSGGGRTERLEVLLVAVANSDQYGNHARIAPGARVDDGRLELVAVRSTGWCGMLALVPQLFLGTLDRSPGVLRLTGPRFTIERSGPGPIHTDGETHEAGARVEVAVRPRSLRLVVPATSRAVVPAAAPRRFALLFP